MNDHHEAAPDLAQIMHTLGRIARAVWPLGRMPVAVQVNLLARPDLGFKLMVSHMDFKHGDTETILRLLDRVPADFTVPSNGLTEEHELHFWAGFQSDPTER